MRLSGIYTYPLKGGYRQPHARVAVEPWGLAGDRRWLVTDADGGFLSQRTTPALGQVRVRAAPGGVRLTCPGHPDLPVARPAGPGGEPVVVWRSTVDAAPAGPAADAWLSRVLGRPARLHYGDDPARRPFAGPHARPGDAVSFADSSPVTLASLASLAALNEWLAEAGAHPVPVHRFRPNLVLDGAAAWAEDAWPGRRLRVGDAVFRVAKAAGRCQVVNTDQETGRRSPEVLRALAARRTVDQRVLFAVHLVPDQPAGVVEVGAPVALE